MDNSHSDLDDALKALVSAMQSLQSELEDKLGEDEDAYSQALVEVLEGAIESAVENQNSTTGFFAFVVSSLSEALEQLDPSAFEDEVSDDYDINSMNYSIDDDGDRDIDIDDDINIDDE